MKFLSSLFGRRHGRPEKPSLPHMVEVDDKTGIRFDYYEIYAEMMLGSNMIPYSVERGFIPQIYVHTEEIGFDENKNRKWERFGSFECEDLGLDPFKTETVTDDKRLRNLRLSLAYRIVDSGIPLAYREKSPGEDKYAFGMGITINPEIVGWKEFLKRQQYVFGEGFYTWELDAIKKLEKNWNQKILDLSVNK